ncbi:MAG: CorA family divalent cation transporter [Pirellulaceae bacterium]
MARRICSKKVNWIDLQQPTPEELSELSDAYGLDYFTVKDCLEPGHLPKIELFPGHTFVIVRAYTASPTESITTVQELSDKLAFFFSENFLITIHRADFSFIEKVMGELERADEPWQVVDVVIELIWHVIDTFRAPAAEQSRKADETEKTIFLKDFNKVSLEKLYYQKSECRISKKLLTLTRQVLDQIRGLGDRESALQDAKDLLLKVTLEYDEALDDANNLMHTYLSVASQKTNDVMKLLTVFSVFFLPMTFIAGVYGMNFDHMPELHWDYGYFLAWSAMLAISAGIIWWFKKSKIL